MFHATIRTMEAYSWKIPIVGNGAVGKTSLLLRLTQDTFSENYQMTIGSNFSTKTMLLPDGVEVRLQLWDLAGQPDFKLIRPSFYYGSKACVYVYDVTSTQSVSDLDLWKMEVEKHAPGITGILLGNKADLTGSRQVASEVGEEIRKKLGLLAFWETSAKTGENVGKAFEFLAAHLVEEARKRAKEGASPAGGGERRDTPRSGIGSNRTFEL
ncbi:MAG: Rab family GTPase [Promethearchaeota archaeon]